jgi:hypothetical protein
MKFLFRLDHIYKLDNHFEKKHIGVFSSEEKAKNAIQSVINKPGFCDHPTGFRIRKRWYVIRPRLLNITYWVDGFETYYYSK